jgi:hypothetical protein
MRQAAHKEFVRPKGQYGDVAAKWKAAALVAGMEESVLFKS